MIEVINELLSAFMVNVRALSLTLLNVRTLGILVVVLIMMVLVSNIYSHGKIKKQNITIEELESSKKSEKKNVRNLKNELREYEKQLDELNVLVNQEDEIIKELNIHVEERENYLTELKEKTSKLEEFSGNKIGKLELLARAQKAQLEELNSQLKKREEIITNLTSQAKEQVEYIDTIKIKNDELDQQNQLLTIRVKEADTKIVEIEKKLLDLNKEASNLKTQKLAMQDDFSYLTGIGKKVSSILRLAGIASFSQLATTDVNRIREILEEVNPSLLNITDPTTWPEQARLAAKGDWKTLSALEESIKKSKRRSGSAENDDFVEQIETVTG
jgi:predicted flap endonuclease-1-like 5' DNA nuclease